MGVGGESETFGWVRTELTAAAWGEILAKGLFTKLQLSWADTDFLSVLSLHSSTE